MAKRNSEKLMEQSLYDLLCSMNENLRAFNCKATGGTVTGEIHCGLVRSRDDFRFYEELAAEAWNSRADLPEPPKE